MVKGRFLVLAVAAVLAASPAFASGDAKKGEKVFHKCKSCHSDKPGVNRVGPSLFGVVGRKAGTEKGYTRYKGLKGADFVWNEENLNKWLKNPRKFVGKATTMTFRLRKEDDRENVIAYLKTLK